MSQSSELEEGEHPKSQEPIIQDEDKNNHTHKLYTRGVGALLDGIFQEPVKSSDAVKHPAKLLTDEIDAHTIPKAPTLSDRYIM